MGKAKITKVKSWDEMPLFMTIEQVSENLGIGRKIVDKWFEEKTFPVIKDGIKKVDKENLEKWLDIKYANFIVKNTRDDELILEIKKLLKGKNCDDLTREEAN